MCVEKCPCVYVPRRLSRGIRAPLIYIIHGLPGRHSAVLAVCTTISILFMRMSANNQNVLHNDASATVNLDFVSNMYIYIVPRYILPLWVPSPRSI